MIQTKQTYYKQNDPPNIVNYCEKILSALRILSTGVPSLSTAIKAGNPVTLRQCVI